MSEIVTLRQVIILLVFTAGGAQAKKVVRATRSRGGDQYWVYSDNNCEERICSPDEPNVVENGTCENNNILRNKCKWHEVHMFIYCCTHFYSHLLILCGWDR